MTQDNNGTKKTKLVFEKVNIENFVGDSRDAALHAIVSKIANNNQTVALGIESLLTEKLILRSFERALAVLITAKNDRILQNVEAGFQTTINEVRSYNDRNSPYMTRQKTSLYLYTLQHLIMNLDRWVFPHREKNTFVPTLKKKLQIARSKSRALGIGDNIIRRECYLTGYQLPYDPVLRNFEFLDESRVDAYINRLHRFEITHNPDDLYDAKMFPSNRETNQKTKAVETIIRHMEKKFNIKELDINCYKKNFSIINQEILKIFGANDLAVIYEIVDAVTQYLEAKKQFQIQAGVNSGRAR